MPEKTRGIVLHHFKYGESSLIAHIYTLHRGRRSFLIKGARTRKSKSKTNLFQSLNILNLEYYYKETSQLLIVSEAGRAKTFNNFPYDIKKSSQAMFIAEVLHKCLMEEAPDHGLFNFLEHALEYFDLMEEDSSNFHLAFLLKLTQFLGISPSVTEKENQKILVLSEHKKAMPAGSHSEKKDFENARLLFQFFHENIEKCSLHSLSRQQRNNLLEEILMFFTNNGYKLNALNSLDVLKTLFSD